jgi:glycosyltransferase involved in cell wall biosynthesis
VVHVVVAGEIGGAERMLTDLASRPDATGADHAVALLTPNRALATLFEEAGLRVRDRGRVREGPLPFLWQTFGPAHAAWIASVLREERADVAHLHTLGSQVVGTRGAIQAGARVLRTEHSTRAFDDPTCWPFSRWSLRRTDASVAISDHVRSAATARAPWAAEKMRVVPNGVDTIRFAPRQTPRAQQYTFVLVGRLEPRKGVDLAIDALARVPGARLDVIGDGKQRGPLQVLTRSRGVSDRVRFLGHVDDTRALVAASDAALCTSRSEGLGIALLEAMAMGRPVVGFSVGGVPEIVTDEHTGLLSHPGDVEALAVRMRYAARSPDRMRALGETARRRVVECFSVEAMRANYGQVYAGLARG